MTLNDDQLGLFAQAAQDRAADPEDEVGGGRFCNYRPERARPEVQPCVRPPGHEGGHAIWRVGKIDLVMWLVDDDGNVLGNREMFRGRVGGMGAARLTPADVFGMYEAANGLAEVLAAE